jgi:hypothetical protein
MNGTLCRCMTYYRVQAAIKRAVTLMAAPRDARADATLKENGDSGVTA